LIVAAVKLLAANVVLVTVPVDGGRGTQAVYGYGTKMQGREVF
jgi:hypothetical protein